MVLEGFPRITLFRSCIDGAGKFRVRIGRFCRDDDVGPIFGRFQGNLLADAAAGARDEQRAAGQFALS